MNTCQQSATEQVGWENGPANPFARHTARLRQAMVQAVTEQDMQLIMQKMLALAAAGSIPARF